MKKILAATAVAAIAATLSPSVANAQVPDPLPDESIAEVAAAAGFDTLLAAATAAGLDGTLADCSAGPFTVFAPTEDAFAALDPDLLTAALGDPEGLLTDILNYHIVPDIVPAADVVAATSLTTALGADLAVEGTVLNGSVNITGTDNWACNGVVHVIDAVLLPPSLTPAPETTTTTVPTPTIPDGGLPATGNENTIMALVAAALIAAGMALLAVRRRSTI